MKAPKGYTLCTFPSPLDGKECVAILTLESTNRKTGNMCQVWIMLRDVNPVQAIEDGDDYSICGNCIHRKNRITKQRSCYVNVGQSPNSIWKAYHRDAYPDALNNIQAVQRMLKGRSIRWGAYGDPALIPFPIFETFNDMAKAHTGYTHQWRESFARIYRHYFQASCDGLNDYLEATAHGWHTFAVLPVGTQDDSFGKQCPATIEQSMAQCVTCKLCDGGKKNIWVEAHGSGKKHVQLV
jgi:hypothetical protein